MASNPMAEVVASTTTRIASSLKPRSEQMDDDFSTWEIVAVAMGTDGVGADVFEQSFELLRFMGEATRTSRLQVQRRKTGACPSRLARMSLVVCGSVPCKDLSRARNNYYPDLAESLPVDATSPGESKPNGERIKRNPWVFIEVEKLLGSRTMGLEIIGAYRLTILMTRHWLPSRRLGMILSAYMRSAVRFKVRFEDDCEVQGAVLL